MSQRWQRNWWGALAVGSLLLVFTAPASAQPGTECWDCIEWGGCFFCQGQVEWGWDDCATPSCGHCSLGAFCTVGLASNVAADGSVGVRPEVLALLGDGRSPGPELIDADGDGKPEYEYRQTPEVAELRQLCDRAIVWRRHAPEGIERVLASTRRLVL